MKFLLFLLLFSLQAQSIDSLQLEIQRLRQLNQSYEQQMNETTEQINLLVERVEDCKELSRKIAEMKKENETLREIMKSYIRQIDTLNNENSDLRRQLEKPRKE